MKSKRPETIALILGAGFPRSAEIPFQAEFPSYVLSENFLSHVDRAISAVLTDFMADVFGWNAGGVWPTLERSLNVRTHANDFGQQCCCCRSSFLFAKRQRESITVDPRRDC